MSAPLALALPLILAAVLVASGIAKLRRPDDLAGWSQLGVPAPLRRPWLLRTHPWAEIALGAALALLGGALGLAAALVAVALVAVYLVMIVRLVRRDDDASCACFGARTQVTGVTVARNAWLTALAVATASVIWSTPLWGGAVVAATDAEAWAWIGLLAVAGVTVALILWPDHHADAEPDAAAAPTGGIEVADAEADYLRARTPAVTVMLADGTTANLRHLTSQRPVLLLAVSETCGSCTPVIDRLGEWRALLPEVEVRFLIQMPPEMSGLSDTAEPQTLHDPRGDVRASIADWATPTAVLFGVDGMLAGGPESGVEAIEAFVADIRASLDEMQAAMAGAHPAQ